MLMHNYLRIIGSSKFIIQNNRKMNDSNINMAVQKVLLVKVTCYKAKRCCVWRELSLAPPLLPLVVELSLWSQWHLIMTWPDLVQSADEFSRRKHMLMVMNYIEKWYVSI
jgi:hypothetical protein